MLEPYIICRKCAQKGKQFRMTRKVNNKTKKAFYGCPNYKDCKSGITPEVAFDRWCEEYRPLWSYKGAEIVKGDPQAKTLTRADFIAGTTSVKGTNGN